MKKGPDLDYQEIEQLPKQVEGEGRKKGPAEAISRQADHKRSAVWQVFCSCWWRPVVFESKEGKPRQLVHEN